MDIITRKEAKLQGLKRYYTGKPCKRGHLSERYTKNCCCMKCNNMDVAQYYFKNVEKRSVYNKQHYYDNHEHYKRMSILWNKNNPEKRAKSDLAQKYTRENATPEWYETELIKQLYLKRDELSDLWGIQLHVDHIIPLRGENVCGLHCWDNLQLLEASLNISKGNRIP